MATAFITSSSHANLLSFSLSGRSQSVSLSAFCQQQQPVSVSGSVVQRVTHRSSTSSSGVVVQQSGKRPSSWFSHRYICFTDHSSLNKQIEVVLGYWC